MSVFSYLCNLCNRPAIQSPVGILVKNDEGKDIRARTLGTWSCTWTGRQKKTKVVRKRLDNPQQ